MAWLYDDVGHKGSVKVHRVHQAKLSFYSFDNRESKITRQLHVNVDIKMLTVVVLLSSSWIKINEIHEG